MLRSVLWRRFAKSAEEMLTESISRTTIHSNIDPNDYQRITIKTIQDDLPGKVRLLTLPHTDAFSDMETFYDVANKLRGSHVLFDFDPTRLLHITRRLQAENYKATYNQDPALGNPNHIVSLTDILEPIHHVDSIATLLMGQSDDELPMSVLAESFRQDLLMPQDRNFLNKNVFSLFLFLTLREDSDFTIGFGGMPESILRAKAAASCAKTGLFESYIRFLRFTQSELEANKAGGKQRHFGPNEAMEMNLRLNLQLIRSRYLITYATEVCKKVGGDVTVVADPLMRQQFESMEEMALIRQGIDLDFNDVMRRKEIEEEYKEMLKQTFESQEMRAAAKQRLEEQGGAGSQPLNDHIPARKSNFFTMPWNEISRIDEVDNRLGASDMIFKMALWDVAFGTRFYESEFISNRYYYLRKDINKITKESLADFDRQFFMSYTVLSKLRDQTIKDIRLCQNPVELRDAFERLKEETGLKFDFGIAPAPNIPQ